MDNETKIDHVTEAVQHILQRDDDGNFHNPHLNALEEQLFIKSQNDGMNNNVGESVENAFNTELIMELAKTLAAIVKKFDLE